MPQQYVADQPSGFENYIRNVAIIGASGQQGSCIAEQLLKTGKHTVTAITREGSTSTFAPGIESRTINYEDTNTIVEALKGQDALVITLSTQTAKDVPGKLIEAAAKAGVKFVLPNEWGLDTSIKSLVSEAFLNAPYFENRALIEKLGVSSWISVACGFWYQYSLAIPNAYGFDIPNRSVTFYDDGNTKFNTSTWDQAARAVASLMSMKIYPDDSNDKSPTLDTHFRNKFAYVSSFRVSQKDMYESLKRVTGTTDSDWTESYQPSGERNKEGWAEFQAKPGMLPYVKFMYSRGLSNNGDGDFETRHGLANEILDLPVEDLDDFTKVAVERSQKAKA